MEPPPFVLEICLDCIQSCETLLSVIQQHYIPLVVNSKSNPLIQFRIELCSALSLGGLTPSYGLYHAIERKIQASLPYLQRANITLDICVMMRPRAGNFVYSEEEIDMVIHDVEYYKQHGAMVNGFVFGALQRGSKEVDAEAVRRVVEACGTVPVTFHRAIDLLMEDVSDVSNVSNVSNAMLLPDQRIRAAINQLIGIGVSKMLTSGRAVSAIQGMKTLGGWNRHYGDQITFIAAGGISSASDIRDLVYSTNIRQFHSSARKKGVETDTGNQSDSNHWKKVEIAVLGSYACYHHPKCVDHCVLEALISSLAQLN